MDIIFGVIILGAIVTPVAVPGSFVAHPLRLGRRSLQNALVGFQGRGWAEVVQPHCGHACLLVALRFPWAETGMALLGQH